MVPKVRPFQVSRRTLYGIAVLAVAFAIALAGMAYYLDVHRYPSEHTPLVLHPWGISWVMEQEDPNPWFLAAPFENITLSWTADFSSAVGTSPLDTRYARASTSEFKLPGNFTELSDTYGFCWMSDDVVNGVRILGPFGIFITDNNGNGLFDCGDAISLFHGVYEGGTLVHQGFQNNTVYGIGLNPSGALGFNERMEFKYAIHHGTLFAWESYWP
jgi:hypothetical protein